MLTNLIMKANRAKWS